MCRVTSVEVPLSDEERELVTVVADYMGVSVEEFLRTYSVGVAEGMLAKISDKPE